MQHKLQKSFDKLEALKSSAQNCFSSYPENVLNNSLNGKWSALQHMGHIITSETKGLEYMKKKIQASATLGKPKLKERIMGFVLNTFLKTGIKFKAPAVLGEPQPYYNPDKLFEEWSRLRAEYISFLDPLDAETAQKLIYKHPVAGRLSIVQALDFMAIHLQRHFRAAQRELQ